MNRTNHPKLAANTGPTRVRDIKFASGEKTPMKRIPTVVYILFGIGALIIGVASLLIPERLAEEAVNSPHLAHIMREQGASMIFVGLVAFWYGFNHGGNRIVHYSLLVFAFALSAIHWFEYLNDNRTLASPLINSIPLVALLLITPLLPRSEAA
jgi:hypothetical protein